MSPKSQALCDLFSLLEEAAVSYPEAIRPLNDKVAYAQAQPDTWVPDQDFATIELVVEALPDGEVVLPQDPGLSADLAEALGDPNARQFCKQSEESEVVQGKRMCG